MDHFSQTIVIKCPVILLLYLFFSGFSTYRCYCKSQNDEALKGNDTFFAGILYKALHIDLGNHDRCMMPKPDLMLIPLCKRNLSHSVTVATLENRMKLLLVVVFLTKSASACRSKKDLPLTSGRCPDIKPNFTLDRDRGCHWKIKTKQDLTLN